MQNALKYLLLKLLDLFDQKISVKNIIIIRVIAIGIVPYVVYILLRSVIDAGYIKPINAINTVAALLFFIIGASLTLLFDTNYIYVVGIFTMSIWVLGLLSLIATRNIFKRNNHCQAS